MSVAIHCLQPFLQIALLRYDLQKHCIYLRYNWCTESAPILSVCTIWKILIYVYIHETTIIMIKNISITPTSIYSALSSVPLAPSIYSSSQITLLWSFVYKYVWTYVFLSLGWIVRVVWLDHMVGMFHFLRNKWNLFSGAFLHIYITRSRVWDPVAVSPHPYQHVVWSVFLILASLIIV